MYVGIPETGNTCELEAGEYAVRIDERFYTLGGEKAGYDRSQFLCYEVKSLENHRVGDKARFLGEERYICAKKGSVVHGQMEFTYTLASPAWAGERRLGNKNFSGLSLLGTVSACSNETVQLKLDIDQGKPEQKLYPFNWVPATGNMMYMMPQEGTRVSLYFKGDEETSAVAVNCIRSGRGCARSDYRDKGLTTEHGMQLKLYRDSMGVETPANKFLMDASKGIEISGSRQLHISAAGDVRIEGKEVCISGFEKVRTYTGILKLTEEEELELEVKAKIELSEGDEGQEADIRGERITYYLAWEHADLSSPMFRYRDEPEDKSFDWWGLMGNVAGGLAVTAGVAILGAVGAGLAAGTAIGSAVFGGATAIEAAQAVGTAAFLTGSMYVGSQALSDVLSGRLSSTDTYIRRALAGSIVGIFSGASTLMLADAGLLATIGSGFAEGFAGEAITQKLLNENGEIDWAQCIRSGLFTAVMDGGLYAMRTGGKSEWRIGFEEKKKITSRNINGQRTSQYRILTSEEIESLKADIEALGADLSVFRFNEGFQTGYSDRTGLIYIRGDVLPDLYSTHPRDLMSQRAVLAHEYYGHKYFGELFGDNNPPIGAWNDEFRASYSAALKAPNLTDMDRMYLMADALERAKEAGVNIKITDIIRRVLYGY